MDPITHGVVTYKVVGKEPSTILYGVAPDVAWYLTYPVWVICKHELKNAISTGIWPDPPKWMLVLHSFTHSFIIAILAATAIRLITGKWPAKLITAWLLHIVIDIPSHSKNPWGPKFLWPISNIAFDGISWAQALSNLIAQKGFSNRE